VESFLLSQQSVAMLLVIYRLNAFVERSLRIVVLQEEFQQYANRLKRKWLGSDARVKALSPEEIEAEFWRIVEQSKEPVEVLYGSDLDTSIYGKDAVCDQVPVSLSARLLPRGCCTVQGSPSPLPRPQFPLSVPGSGFPRLGDAKGRGESGAWEEYARSCWNLNNMPRDAASVLNRIDDQIPGVMVPWL
jgi:histone demethylase JARID1